jgi:hypothetical protein
LTDHDRVYYLRKGSDTCYVFPEVLLTSYHVVNDVIEGEPVGVTFCFLAGSACHFSRRVEDSVLTFGLTGQLYGGNSVLFDKETGTDWLQMNGEPLRGHFFGKARLGAKPLAHTTWRRIKERKDIKVLAPVRSMAEYRRFQQDMEAERLGQKVVESQKKLDPRLLPYTKGLGIVVHDQARFYPENPLGPRSLHEDRVGSWALLVIRDGKEDLSRIYRRRHKNRILSFELTDGAIIDRQTHSTWNEDGRCVAGPLAGAELEAPSYSEVYWFVWSSLYSDTAL